MASHITGNTVLVNNRSQMENALAWIQELYPDWFVGIRQDGVVMGLEFDFPQGAKPVMKHLYENGVWAIFSTLDPRVLTPSVLFKGLRLTLPAAWRDRRC